MIMSLWNSHLWQVKDAFTSQATKIMWPSSPESAMLSIKCKVGYTEDAEEIGTTESKMASLEINQRSSLHRQFGAPQLPSDHMEIRGE